MIWRRVKTHCRRGGWWGGGIVAAAAVVVGIVTLLALSYDDDDDELDRILTMTTITVQSKNWAELTSTGRRSGRVLRASQNIVFWVECYQKKNTYYLRRHQEVEKKARHGSRRGCDGASGWPPM
jgi:hypothetical protein